MNRMLVAAALAASVIVPATPVRADDPLDAAFSAPHPAAPLADAALRDVRGRYVVPQTANVPIAAPALNVTARQSAQSATTSAGSGGGIAAPGSGNALGGRVVYFGFDLSSAWTTHGSNGATTYSAGEAVGIDLSGAKPTVTVQSYTTRGGALGNAAAPGSGSATGTIADGRIAGVAQSIQIAGNGNAVINGATVDVSAVRPTLVVGSVPGTMCGSPCNVNVDPGALGVAINLPGGQVSQGISGGSVYQQVQLTTNNNAVSNQLKLALQVAPGTTSAPSAPLNLIPPTLQLLH